jgi:hypothetical protein
MSRTWPRRRPGPTGAGIEVDEEAAPARGASASSPATRFPAPVGHFLLAAAGLVVWIVYLIAGKTPLAWAAFMVLLPVALLGFTMFAVGSA